MKRHIKKSIDFIHSLTFWQLIFTLVILIPLSLYGLRQNSQTMGELKLAVIEADKSGQGTQDALKDLSSHVFEHMNTSTEVVLAETYNRRVAQIQKAASESLDMPDLFPAGQAACASVPAATRNQCIQDYIVERSANNTGVLTVEYPEKGLYRFAFAAPLWSPDLAGWSLLGCAVSLLLIAFKLIHKKIHPHDEGGL